MKVAGFDIGGANTDLAIIDFEGEEIKNIRGMNIFYRYADILLKYQWHRQQEVRKVFCLEIVNLYK